MGGLRTYIKVQFTGLNPICFNLAFQIKLNLNNLWIQNGFKRRGGFLNFMIPLNIITINVILNFRPCKDVTISVIPFSSKFLAISNTLTQL